MADNIYNVTLLGSVPGVTLTDDGTGSDWLIITGSYLTYTTIDLKYTYTGSATDGTATSAWGRYDTGVNTGHTLQVNGAIENARGCDSADFINGNELNNILYGDAAATGIGGSDTIGGGNGNDTVYGGAGSDSLGGAAGDDILYGDAGDDIISGGEGNDRIIGGLGADELYGGPGLDNAVDYATSNAAVQVNITSGSATTGIGGHAAGDLISGFNNVIGSAFADIITDTVAGTIAFGYNDNSFFGGAGHDVLVLGGGDDDGHGGAGNDSIDGGLGDDTIEGGDDIDLIAGGSGADVLSGGGTWGDALSYVASAAAVNVNLAFGFATTGAGGDAAGDQISGFTAIYGSALGDTLTDSIKFGVALGGNNSMFAGGGGNDVLILGGGRDRGLGGGGDDRIYGEQGNDLLYGGAGNDMLVGGAGADVLTGDAGADVFLFAAALHSLGTVAGRDTIVDFNHAELDRINLRNIDANILTSGVIDHFTFIGAGAFDGRAGLLRTYTSGANVIVEADLDGNQSVDFSILMQNCTGLIFGDFML